MTVGGRVTESQAARPHPWGQALSVPGIRFEGNEEKGGVWRERQDSSRYGGAASPEVSGGGSSNSSDVNSSRSRRLRFRAQGLQAAGPALRRSMGAAMRPRGRHLAAAEPRKHRDAGGHHQHVTRRSFRHVMAPPAREHVTAPLERQTLPMPPPSACSWTMTVEPWIVIASVAASTMKAPLVP